MVQVHLAYKNYFIIRGRFKNKNQLKTQTENLNILTNRPVGVSNIPADPNLQI